MDKLLKKLLVISFAFVLTLSSATIAFGGGPGNPPPPVIPEPPTGSAGG